MNICNNSLTLPFVSVIVPTLNAEKTIKIALEALTKQKYPHENIEILVVDGGSVDNTRDIVLQFPVTLIDQLPNHPGDSGARNTGALRSRGEILATTDADDKVHPNWISKLVETFQNNKDVAAVIGRSIIDYDINNWKQRLIAELFICLRGSRMVKCIFNEYGHLRSNLGTGPNQAFRREIFFAIGGYNEELSSGMDLEIVWRLEKLGYRVLFQPEAIVYKSVRQNFTSFLSQTYKRAHEGVAIYLRYPEKMSIRYKLSIVYIPTLLLLLNVSPLLGALGLLFPTLYLTFLAIKVKDQLRTPVDIPFLLILGFIYLVVYSVGLLTGFFKHFISYIKRKIKKYKIY